MYYYSLSSSTSQEVDLIYCQCSVWIGNYSFRKYCSSSFWVYIWPNIQRAHGLKALMQKDLHSVHCRTVSSADTSQGFPPLFQTLPLIPSTCRPPLCRWEDRSLQLRPSVPDASESVRWGPASQSANVGGPSWWCLSVPGCRPQLPQRSRSPWVQRGLGCGRPLARPGTVRRGSAEAGTGAGRPGPPSLRQPPLGSPRWTYPASWSLGCPVHPPLRRRMLVCDTRVGSRRCEGESGSGFEIAVVGRWVCWTLRWRALDCLSCCPENKRNLDYIISKFNKVQGSKPFVF